VVREELANLLIEYQVKSILDIPCGDFYWMNKINLNGINYIGADIVEQLILDVRKKHGEENKKFEVRNLIEDKLPTVDLIFIRDCFVHLSYSDIMKSIDNIKASRSKYLLTTSFVNQVSNRDIITGDWRPLNLQIAPFNFPSPITLIDEKSTESGGSYKDKSLLLWDISSLG